MECSTLLADNIRKKDFDISRLKPFVRRNFGKGEALIK
jgi:hypothetical protein